VPQPTAPPLPQTYNYLHVFETSHHNYPHVVTR